MEAKRWTLCDVEHDTYVEHLLIDQAEAGDFEGNYCVRKRRLRGGLREGVDLIEVDNGHLRFTVLPDRGMGIWKAACGDVALGWQSPVKGPVHPHFVRLDEPSGIGWLDGFDELVCRCGLSSNGAPERGPDGRLLTTLHGRIANLPAHFVEVAIDTAQREISVRGIVDEARLFGNNLRLESIVKTRAGADWLRIVDRVTNLSSQPADLQLLYHINLGHPLLTPGAKLHAPIVSLAPRDAHSASDVATWDAYHEPQAGSREFAHFADVSADSDGMGRVVLEAAGGQRGASVVFNRRQLPCFTIWKSQLPISDGYVTGLEPGTNFPNVQSFERSQGRVIALEPGETREFQVELHAHPDAEALRAALERVDRVSAGRSPEIARQPRAGWSP